MIGAGWGVLSPVITRVSTKAIGAARTLVWGVATQSATYLAVDKVSDYVLDESDDGYAESALDVILSIYLHSKGGKLFKKWKGDKGSGLNRKRREFFDSLGRTPWFDVRSLRAAGVVFGRNYRQAFDVMFSKTTGKVVLSGKRSGRVYAVVSSNGTSIRGINKLDGVSQFVLGAGAALTIDELTTVGLECLVDSLGAVLDHSGAIDEVDQERVSDSFDTSDDRLSFIRDPDVWLRNFGTQDTPAGVLVDRAMHWFLNQSQAVSITEVDDSKLENVSLVDVDGARYKNLQTGRDHVMGKGGIVYDTELGKVVIDNGDTEEKIESILDGRAFNYLLDLFEGFSADSFFGDVTSAVESASGSESEAQRDDDGDRAGAYNKEQQSTALSTL